MILSLLLPRRDESLPPTWPIGEANWPVILTRRPGSRRVTLRLCAVSDTLRITAPPRCTSHVLRAVLNDHTAYLAAQVAGLPPRLPFADAASIPYRGDVLCIMYRDGARTEIDETRAVLTVGGHPEHLQRRVRDVLKRRALVLLADAVTEAYSRAADFAPRPVKRIALGDPRGRWGSCAADGTLRFSWRLIFAPRAVLFYVAVHEVAHLAEMSHNARFWAIVTALDPDAVAARAWLKRHGSQLHRVGPAIRST
ncbi:MAG: M48 family metallopeptidase [Rhodospirillaceae bacterium]|nr:M48 family metallopeptidase [Rhodospirillaceae bacterium]